MMFRSLLPVLLGLCLAAPAHAKLQDISWAPKGEQGQILLSFADQPSAAKVFVHPGFVDVDVLGVSETAGTINPAIASDIKSVERIPAPGGARFRITLDQTPKTANVQVYRNAVLVTAGFTSPLRTVQSAPMMAAVANPKPVAKPPVILVDAHKSAAAEPGHDDKPVHDAKLADNDAAKPVPVQPKPKPAAQHDDDMGNGNDDTNGLPDVTLPKQGVGMIRDASLRLAQGLSKAQCDAAEKQVSRDPWALDNLSLYGACLAREGRAKDAREVFERLITFDPETVSAYLGLGAIAQDAGELHKAQDYYEEALSLGGSDAEASRVRTMLKALQAEMDRKKEGAGHDKTGIGLEARHDGDVPANGAH